MGLAAFIISIVALVAAMLALPTVLQMIWGKPKLVIAVSDREVTAGKVLQVELFNPPIQNKLLRWLGVKRMTAGDVMGSFKIQEHGSRRVIFPGEVPEIITHNGTGGHQRISLAASFFPATFGVVLSLYEDKKAYVFEEQETILPPGKYCVCIHFMMEGEPIETERTFVVTKAHPFAYWE